MGTRFGGLENRKVLSMPEGRYSVEASSFAERGHLDVAIAALGNDGVQTVERGQ